MKKTFFLTGLVFMLLSCNSGNKESSTATSDTKAANKSSKSEGDSYDCLNKFSDDYSLLLSKEEMAEVQPINFDEAKKELRSGSYGQHQYQWPSDRPTITMEMSGMKMEVPDDNTVGVKNLSFYSDKTDLKSVVGNFDMGYKKLSQEELDKIDKNLKKAESEVKQNAEDFMKVRETMQWESVDGLGSSAWYKWDNQWGGELVVLAGRAQFSIVTKVSSDPDENREIAKNLAQKVIAKCK